MEDDPIGITVLRHVLQRRLKNVDCVASGREALEAVARRHYDLILMDLQMPDINGLEAASIIRQMKGYSDVPILALTASCSDQVKEQCRAIGMKAFLSKPIDANELWSAVSRYLGREIPRFNHRSASLLCAMIAKRQQARPVTRARFAPAALCAMKSCYA